MISPPHIVVIQTFLAVFFWVCHEGNNYTTFFFFNLQEDDFLLENAYYSEMKDAGFFDADWD